MFQIKDLTGYLTVGAVNPEEIMKNTFSTRRSIFSRWLSFAAVSSVVLLNILDVSGVVEQNPAKLSPLASSPNTSLRNEVQRAIDKGTAWITQSQNTNGFWSTADHPALTGLALMSLQGPNAKRHQTKEPEAVTRGYSFLMRNIQPDGGIYRKDLQSYNTSISLLALTLNQTPEAKDAMAKARKFLIGLQAHFDIPGSTNNAYDGGIGYGGGIDKRPDLSNTSWALEALHYSKLALADKQVGETSDLNWSAAIAFIQRCLLGRDVDDGFG